MKRARSTEFVLTNYAKNLIKFKARQLTRRRDFQTLAGRPDRIAARDDLP